MERYRKIGIVGAVILGLTVMFLFLGLGPMIRFGVADQTALKKGSEMRDIYLKIPFPLDFKVYFFNVTNPEKVQKGEKPILQEVGPYCYDEFKEKINVVDNDPQDTLTYYPYDIYKFNQEKSGNLSDDDFVTIINPLVVGMVNQVNKDSPALLSIVNQALGPIFHNPETVYLTEKVRNILFDGMPVDCSSTDFTAKAVCIQIKSQMPGLKEAEQKNVYLISLLGTRNATLGRSVAVMRGTKSYRDVGRVVEMDGKKEIKLWSREDCNHFKGTDGWIIPPMLKPGEGIWTHSGELCRNMLAFYVKDEVVKGIHVRRYEANLGDMQQNEEDKCFCPAPNNCLKKGIIDLSKCLGVPIYGSLPHFLEADPSFLDKVEGLSPSSEKHGVILDLEPLTSTPIKAAKRLQLNLQLQPLQKIPFMTSLPEALHPIFWIEEGIDLEGPLFKKIKTVVTLLSIVYITRWVFLGIGLAVVSFSAYLYFKNRDSLKIVDLAAKNSQSGSGRSNKVSDKSTADINSLQSENKPAKSVLSGQEFDRYQHM